MYVQENKFICSNFSRIYCLMFFNHVLSIDQINDINKFVVNTKFIALYSKCSVHHMRYMLANWCYKLVSDWSKICCRSNLFLYRFRSALT